MASSSQNTQTKITPFSFPLADSKLLPDPTKFLSPNLLSSPIPTNSFFQNFILNNGDQPCYLHPYLIKLLPSSVSLCYPSPSYSSTVITQNFTPDITISTSDSTPHCVSSFSDLTLTVDFPLCDLRYLLARGSPYVTLELSTPLCLSFSTQSSICSLSPGDKKASTKNKIELENNHVWIIYSSSDLKLDKKGNNHLSSNPFSGIVRLAMLPDQNPKSEEILDQYSTCYPVSGLAVFSKPFCMDYIWETKGWGDLLMLAHSLHLKLLSCYGSGVKVLEGLKFKGIDGDLVAVVGSSWKLRTEWVPVTWHSIGGISECHYPEIVRALWEDVGGLDSNPNSTTHCYHYGKIITRAARLAVIAEEVGCSDVLPAIKKFLKDKIEPWLVGKFEGNGFLYDGKWGGIISKQGQSDSKSDYGFGLYNNHHYYLGYYVFCIAVLAKIDPEWGLKFRAHAYALLASYMSLGKGSKKHPRLRSFDFYKLHSLVGCLTANADGGNSENPTESINAYYSGALMGMAHGDEHLTMVGSTLAGFEIQATQTWWHVREREGIYGGEFSKKKMVGLVWANKREDKLWFVPAERRECVVGIQVLPLIPITEVLYRDVGFVKEVVNWAGPAMGKKEATDNWKGFVYALEAVYDPKSSKEKIRKLKGFDEGNSLSNLLWWVHSRHQKDRLCTSSKQCLFCEYC